MVGIRGQLKAVVGTFLPGASYFLGETLYLSLTDKCNAATLISTRGPGFRMPEDAAFQPLNGLEPSADQLAAVVDLYYSKHEGIVRLLWAYTAQDAKMIQKSLNVVPKSINI